MYKMIKEQYIRLDRIPLLTFFNYEIELFNSIFNIDVHSFLKKLYSFARAFISINILLSDLFPFPEIFFRSVHLWTC